MNQIKFHPWLRQIKKQQNRIITRCPNKNQNCKKKKKKAKNGLTGKRKRIL